MLLTKSPIRFAKVAIEITREVLPQYRTKFSKKDFEWPQLVSCLLVQLYFKLDLRGTEQLLLEFTGVRKALGLTRVPDHTSLCRAYKNISYQELEKLLTATTARLPRLRPKVGRPAKKKTVITDSTGMRQDQASHHYINRRRRLKPKSWPKWSVAIDRKTHMILAQEVGKGPSGDASLFSPLMDAAQKRRRSDEALADAGYDSEKNLRLCRNRWKVKGIICVKAGRPSQKKPAGAERRKLKAKFPKKAYGQRWQVESMFSAHKRRFGEVLRCRTVARRRRELKLHGILHNLAVLFYRIATEQGCSTFPMSPMS